MNKNFQALLTIILSGAAWYGAFDLSGDFGWLLWLAPVPVLYTCYRVSAGRAFLFAFISFLIGRLSWLPYLCSVLPLAVAILFTVFFPLVFAGIVWIQRRAVLKGLPPVSSSSLTPSGTSGARPTAPWLAILILPFLWTTMEFAMARLGRDGTITSIACTQANYCSLIQVVSLTGMTGLSFLLHLLPSAIAVSWFYGRRAGTPQATRILALPFALFFLTLIVGWIRLARNPVPASNAGAPVLNVLLLTVNESIYQKNTYQPGPAIDSQIRPGTDLVLLPEKAITLTDTTERRITDTLISIARRHRTALIAGYARIRKDHRLDNGALVISREGRLLTDYRKVHLFEGEVLEGFTTGNRTGIFNFILPAQPRTPAVILPSGVAVCKDLDFDDYIRRYDRDHIAVLYVPAWDFKKDGWYHARIAILRGVENGYPIVRNARLGRLMLSDPLGRVLSETECESGQPATLTGSLQPARLTTLYSRWGDWFAWLTVLGACAAIFLLFQRRPA